MRMLASRVGRTEECAAVLRGWLARLLRVSPRLDAAVLSRKQRASGEPRDWWIGCEASSDEICYPAGLLADIDQEL
ncbi:unnamed protein product [Urochloa humidicola]